MKKYLTSTAIVLITLFIFVSTPASALQTPSGIPTEALPDMIDSYVADYISETSPGAAVVVFSHGKIIFSKGYGYADITEKTPVVPDYTIFEYGSVSKLFVYTTIMRLAEKGILDLSADIRQYLSDDFLSNLSFAQPVTLLDIMNHQAGFEDVLTDTVITHPIRKTDFLDILISRQPKQVYQPGTISAYSNYAVALAAYITQIKIDQPLYTYLQNSVFQPLAMNQTTIHPDFLDKPDIRDQRARGYAADSSSGSFREIGWSYIPMYPVGAASGTAEDLARFAMALMPPDNDSGPLFASRRSLDEMLSQTMSMGPDMTGFAHGFIEYDGPYRGVGHGGNTAGFSAQLNIVPEQRFGVIVLANSASEINLTEGITQLLMGHAVKPAASASEDGLPDAAILEDSYISARRPHHGFLKLYGFLGLLQVDALSHDMIEVKLGDQSGTYRQTKPYLFEQTAANGSFFEYNFRKIYFEMREGHVFRISGDFTPLPQGYSLPWLITDAIATGTSTLFFVLMPLILLVFFIFRRLSSRKRQLSHRNAVISKAEKSKLNRHYFLIMSMLTSGLALVINNTVLVARMLNDNYRALSEVHIHLILNFPFALLGLAASIVYIFRWQKIVFVRSQRVLYIITLVMLALVLYALLKWDFIALSYL